MLSKYTPTDWKFTSRRLFKPSNIRDFQIYIFSHRHASFSCDLLEKMITIAVTHENEAQLYKKINSRFV